MGLVCRRFGHFALLVLVVLFDFAVALGAFVIELAVGYFAVLSCCCLLLWSVWLFFRWVCVGLLVCCAFSGFVLLYLLVC